MQIKFEKVTVDFQTGPIRSPLVLNCIDLFIKSGSFTAVVGHTGAGKSSLLKAMNGLLLPREGKVSVGDAVIKQGNNKKELKTIRKRVGMVFQFPESQLFAETVEKDICFGPLNYGMPLKDAKELAKQVIEQVGLDPQILLKSPFSLSGGQKRRVAIAGILAMEPDILVLDEPGAGLDPKGKSDILTLIKNWNQQRGLTTVLVTHDMNDVALFSEEVIVMEKGRVVMHDETRRLFASRSNIEKWHLDLPDARRLQLKIEDEAGFKFPNVCLTADELAKMIVKVGFV